MNQVEEEKEDKKNWSTKEWKEYMKVAEEMKALTRDKIWLDNFNKIAKEVEKG